MLDTFLELRMRSFWHVPIGALQNQIVRSASAEALSKRTDLFLYCLTPSFLGGIRYPS